MSKTTKTKIIFSVPNIGGFDLILDLKQWLNNPGDMVTESS